MLRRAAPQRVLQVVLTLSLCVASLVGAASAQQPAIQYAYDELGQLVAVVDQDGNAAIYVYDAVGNILSIQRVDAASLPGRVAITAVVPGKGKIGTLVSILGKGFGASGGQNAVSFNGVVATVAQASATRITTTVPSGATSGPITVATPLGSAMSPRPFRIVGTLAVTPATVTLGVGGTQQFVVTDGGVETTNVMWTVNDIVGGDPGVGTVSGQGLYTAPTTTVSLRTVTVTATSKDDVTVLATATVMLQPPLPAFLAAAPVGVQVTDPQSRVIVAPGVGIQRAPDGTGLTIVAAAIGVSPPMPNAFSGISQVSVSLEPLITSVSPAAAVRGSASLTLILTGSGLAGLISIEFLLNNTPDAAITVTNLTATAGGTQATAQISITATATLGPRVVRIRAPAGTTTSVGAGGNVFTVQ
jgi:YD repeat-containing protein